MRSSLLIAVVFALMAGCGSGSESSPDAGPGEVDTLAESLAVWQEMKAADDGAYAYTRTFRSWTGYHSVTRFVVEDDMVVRRTFQGYDESDQLLDSFDEQGEEVGSTEGITPVYTIDELYEVCRDEVLTKDPEANQIYLAFRDDGLLERCHYIPSGCQDDCSMGVDIASIDFSL